MRTNLDKIDNLNLHEFVFSSKVVHIMVYKGSKMAKSQLTGKIGFFFSVIWFDTFVCKGVGNNNVRKGEYFKTHLLHPVILQIFGDAFEVRFSHHKKHCLAHLPSIAWLTKFYKWKPSDQGWVNLISDPKMTNTFGFLQTLISCSKQSKNLAVCLSFPTHE